MEAALTCPRATAASTPTPKLTPTAKPSAAYVLQAKKNGQNWRSKELSDCQIPYEASGKRVLTGRYPVKVKVEFQKHKKSRGSVRHPA